ncbi:hypothetical protein Pint_18264 [Pistacia integerrima]|uniref:Uncharacterized protein n=1 Tax=Pistacia integerrima TaxID=434235 RepID=A0ACC0YXG6_9ROSI|nr:hypothetical protein Pint_18264 [Pistacia integerrima]
MSIPILESFRKRKKTPKLFGFHTFGDSGCPITPTGPFRDNIRLFLQQCGELQDYSVEGMPIWCILLVHESSNFVIPLYTIEDTVAHSPHPFCDHCKCTGWSNHFVSKRKYHVIIPNDYHWNKHLKDDVFGVHNHLLHGLIHCNGFGHLLCINGIEGGCKYLCGREIMDLWDRICTILQARKITVEDGSKKKFMDLRLLHGVAYGHPWFGRWGYRFYRGSFGVAEHNYNRAIEILSSLELDNIMQDFRDTNKWRQIKQIIHCYRDMSETQLITLKDLLRFMLTFKSCASTQKKQIMANNAPSLSISKPSMRASLRNKSLVKDKSSNYRKFTNLIANMDSRWSARRLESSAKVIVNALLEKKAEEFGRGGMSRQELRDAARMQIGDTGLLDYVLKSMNNVIVGDHIVCRAVNPRTRLLEYTIHELGNGEELEAFEPEPEILRHHLLPPTIEPGADVSSEVVYLYRNVLLNYPGSKLVGLASQVVLDSKYFVKEWPFKDEQDQVLRFMCQIIPNSIDEKSDLTPRELVMVPLHATILELKKAVQTALRDTYCIMEKLVVTDIENIRGMEDGEVVFGAIESGAEISVRGDGIDLESKCKYEGGDENWKVKCECGAEDDDGERMVACDICEVWQHTRCHGIQDSETVPLLFVCPGCCTSSFAASTTTQSRYEYEFESTNDLFLASESEFGHGAELIIKNDDEMLL